jgi:DNA anti-recombination protein RmuC
MASVRTLLEGIRIEEDEEHEKEMEKLESMSRQIYDTRERIFDDHKRRVTELKECGRVTLPRPLETNNEALIEIRRGMNE